MNVYVWQRLKRVSGNWHSEGGVVAVAGSLDEARELARTEMSDVEEPDIFAAQPDASYVIDGNPMPRVFVFPDAGCC